MEESQQETHRTRIVLQHVQSSALGLRKSLRGVMCKHPLYILSKHIDLFSLNRGDTQKVVRSQLQSTSVLGASKYLLYIFERKKLFRLRAKEIDSLLETVLIDPTGLPVSLEYNSYYQNFCFELPILCEFRT